VTVVCECGCVGAWVRGCVWLGSGSQGEREGGDASDCSSCWGCVWACDPGAGECFEEGSVDAEYVQRGPRRVVARRTN
jgi:hypothetical protein